MKLPCLSVSLRPLLRVCPGRFPASSLFLAGLIATGIASGVSTAQGSHSATFDARNVSRMLVGSADTDGDGAVSMAERDAFLAAYADEAESPLDRDQLLARALVGYYDADQDAGLCAADLTALLERWDNDSSGDISAQERKEGPRAFQLLDGVILNALDTDQDGALSVDEYNASSALDLALWLGAAAAIQEDINGFGPGTMVLTLRASLDADGSGTFDRKDVRKHFADLDRNGDRSVDASELAPARRQAGGGWTLSDSERGRSPAMPWQRSLADALALSQSTGKPLLICVNTDGEAASENLAQGRYTDPEFVKLAEGFIPLLASPNWHTTRALDTRGERVECPRFGHLVCPEHIDEEPELYARYFTEQRIAPRHVGVAPDGTILFDLVLLGNLRSVDRALEEHGNFETSLPDPRGMSEAELLSSRDAAARAELRSRFQAASVESRVRLIGLALSPTREALHPGLLSLALYDSSPLVRSAGAVRMTSAMSLDFVDFAPRLRWIAANDPRLRKELIAGLRAVSDGAADEAQRQRPRRLARIFAALEDSSHLDADLWRLALAGAPAITSAPGINDGRALEVALSEISKLLRQDRDNPDLNGLLAQTSVRMALRIISGEGSGNPQYFLQDAEAAAERVLELRAGDQLARTTLARAKWWLRKPKEAADYAASALQDLAELSAAPITGELLDILAKGRSQALSAALGTEQGWPAQWLAEAVDANRILNAHPSLTLTQALAGISLMENLEDYRGQAELIRSALARFPDSNDLHSWLRWQVMRDGTGELNAAAALEATYTDLATPEGWEATWLWYKGLGLQTAAEAYGEQGQGFEATSAYIAAVDCFEESIQWNAEFTDSANEHIAVIRAAEKSL